MCEPYFSDEFGAVVYPPDWACEELNRDLEIAASVTAPPRYIDFDEQFERHDFLIPDELEFVTHQQLGAYDTAREILLSIFGVSSSEFSAARSNISDNLRVDTDGRVSPSGATGLGQFGGPFLDFLTFYGVEPVVPLTREDDPLAGLKGAVDAIIPDLSDPEGLGSVLVQLPLKYNILGTVIVGTAGFVRGEAEENEQRSEEFQTGLVRVGDLSVSEFQFVNEIISESKVEVLGDSLHDALFSAPYGRPGQAVFAARNRDAITSLVNDIISSERNTPARDTVVAQFLIDVVYAFAAIATAFEVVGTAALILEAEKRGESPITTAWSVAQGDLEVSEDGTLVDNDTKAKKQQISKQRFERSAGNARVGAVSDKSALKDFALAVTDPGGDEPPDYGQLIAALNFAIQGGANPLAALQAAIEFHEAQKADDDIDIEGGP